MSMGVHHPYHLDLCVDDENPSQLIIWPGWGAPHVRCFPRTFCAWPCLLRQVGTFLGSPYDCIVTGITYANPGSRQTSSFAQQSLEEYSYTDRFIPCTTRFEEPRFKLKEKNAYTKASAKSHMISQSLGGY